MPQLHDNTAIHLLMLALGGGAIMLPFFGQEKHFDSREARHAQIAREIVQTAQYVVPRALGEPFIE